MKKVLFESPFHLNRYASYNNSFFPCKEEKCAIFYLRHNFFIHRHYLHAHGGFEFMKKKSTECGTFPYPFMRAKLYISHLGIRKKVGGYKCTHELVIYNPCCTHIPFS